MIMKEILKCPIKLKDKTHNIYVKENSKIQISSHCNTGLTQLILKQNKTRDVSHRHKQACSKFYTVSHRSQYI